MERNKVVLVDVNDRPTGEMDKLEAHLQGCLHRAFSVFIFNGQGEMLLQQRAAGKYHGAGLWTNACCSHPQPNEDVKAGASERLFYEMGIDCPIEEAFTFIYHTPVENGLIEHEYDYVFYGCSNAQPQPNPAEVQAYKWIAADQLIKDIETNPEHYTYWFKSALPRVLQTFNVKPEAIG